MGHKWREILRSAGGEEAAATAAKRQWQRRWEAPELGSWVGGGCSGAMPTDKAAARGG